MNPIRWLINRFADWLDLPTRAELWGEIEDARDSARMYKNGYEKLAHAGLALDNQIEQLRERNEWLDAQNGHLGNDVASLKKECGSLRKSALRSAKLETDILAKLDGARAMIFAASYESDGSLFVGSTDPEAVKAYVALKPATTRLTCGHAPVGSA